MASKYSNRSNDTRNSSSDSSADTMPAGHDDEDVDDATVAEGRFRRSIVVVLVPGVAPSHENTVVPATAMKQRWMMNQNRRYLDHSKRIDEGITMLVLVYLYRPLIVV